MSIGAEPGQYILQTHTIQIKLQIIQWVFLTLQLPLDTPVLQTVYPATRAVSCTRKKQQQAWVSKA